MRFNIYQVKNGYLLNIIYSAQRIESFVFTLQERMRMFAMIDQALGEEPEGSTGMEEPDA